MNRRSIPLPCALLSAAILLPCRGQEGVPASAAPPTGWSAAEIEALAAEMTIDGSLPAELEIFRDLSGAKGTHTLTAGTDTGDEVACTLRSGSARDRYAVVVVESGKADGMRRLATEIVGRPDRGEGFERWTLRADGSILRMRGTTAGTGGSKDRTEFLWTGEVIRDGLPAEDLVVSAYDSIADYAGSHSFTSEKAVFSRDGGGAVESERFHGFRLGPADADPAPVPVPSGDGEDGKSVASPLARLLGGLFGAGSQANPRKKAAAPFVSEAFGIRADFGGQGALVAEEMSTDFPAAAHAVKLGLGGSAAVVVLLDLAGLDPDFDSLATGLLSTVNVSYPDGIDSTSPVAQGTASGREIVAAQTENGNTFDCRLRVLRNGDTACLVGGWIANGGPPGVEKLTALLDSVTITDPMPAPDRAPPGRRDLFSRAEILNAISLALYRDGHYDDAADFFKAAFEAQPRNAVYLTNVLEALRQLNQSSSALDFLRGHLDRFQSNRTLRGWEASLLLDTGRNSEAAEKYAALFDDGLRDEDHLLGYLGLLTGEGKYDDAESAVAKYLAGEKQPSPRVRRWQAQIFSQAGKTDEAVAAIRTLLSENPGNREFADDLAEALVDGERGDEALETIDARLAGGEDNETLRLLRGRAHFILRNHRRAKEEFEKALAFAPGDPIARDWLDHASAALGQGDNSAIKTPLEPLAIPVGLRDVLTAPDADDAGPTSGYHSLVLENTTGFHFEKGKARKRTDRRTVKILNRSGVETYSTLQFSFDPLFENLFVNQLEVYDAEGRKVSQGKASEYYVSGGNASQMATTERILYAPVPGLRVGHTVNYTVTREDRSPSDTFAFEDFLLASDSPALSRGVFVTGDTQSVRAVVGGSDVVPGTSDDAVFWSVAPVPLYTPEPFQPKLQAFLPFLALGGTDDDWESIAREYLAEIGDRLTPSEATRKLAADITRDLPSDEARADALFAWTQNEIAYQAIEFGTRARMPNRPERVLGNRYGDCKDHSVLLRDLLTASGIESHLVLVKGSATIQDSLPSLDQFDHMIVFAPNLRGGTYFDATSKYQSPLLSAPEGLAGARALILNPAAPTLATLPGPRENENRIHSDRVLHLEDIESGDLDVTETLTASGYYGGWLRSYFHNANAADYKRNLQAVLGDLAKFNLEEVRIENEDAYAKPFVIHMRYRIRKAAHRAAEGGTLSPPAIWEDYYYKPTFATDRKHPFSIQQPFLFSSDTRFDENSPWLPSGTNPSEPPASSEAPGVAWSTQRVDANAKWVQSGQLSVRDGEFPREAFSQYQRALDDSLDALKRAIHVLPSGNP